MGSILAFSYIGYFGHIQPHHCLLFPTSPDALPLLRLLPSEESGFWGLVLHSGRVWGLATPLYLLIFAFLYLCSYGICDSFVHDSFLFALRGTGKNAWEPGAAALLRAWNDPLSQESVPPEPSPWTMPFPVPAGSIQENTPNTMVSVPWSMLKSLLPGVLKLGMLLHPVGFVVLLHAKATHMNLLVPHCSTILTRSAE